MTMKTTIHLLLGAALAVFAGCTEEAKTVSLNGEWKFLRDDAEKTDASYVEFDDSAWRTVTVPHDWGIEGPFDPKTGGWQGKLPWRGTGWYRRTFEVSPADFAALKESGRYVYLEFDGVMARPEVYLNGARIGGWDYGYMSFWIDATAHVRPGRNVLAVKASTKTHGSRWYPGAGIYRAVRLVVRPKNHVVPGTLAITTPVVSPESATVKVDYRSSTEGEKSFSFTVAKPRLWEIGKGGLYTLELLGERFTYGIRSFAFDLKEGFILNGRRVQLNGVDLHSDMGPLGMAFDRDVMKRQLLIMKDMGVNALRTSHNAPDPYVLELCDEMGIFVWNECFDKWDMYAGRTEKENLEEYISRNLRQFVRRDRNHPSVFCWSIGNEIGPILQDRKPTGMTNDRFKLFRAAIREFDVTRPVAIGCCSGLGKEVDFNLLDLIGWNYGAGYRNVRRQYPFLPVLCSESASAVSEYGFYEQPPAATKTDYARDTLQVGSYDHNAAPWSDIPDVEFDRMRADRYCAGEFVWTGIDYLGEPTPIAPGATFGITNSNEQCARSSYFGAVDLCGIPKDRFYIYRAHWNPEATTLRLLPHWNWAGREGKDTPVYLYTNGDEAELFLNGKSLGRRRKLATLKRPNLAYGAKATASSEEVKVGKIVHPACDALDGDNETRWCASGGATGQWWQLDFGKPTDFDIMTLSLEVQPQAYGYDVLVSDDAKDWRTYFSKKMGDGRSTIRKADRARYIRIVFNALRKNTYASIRQVLVNSRAALGEDLLENPYYDTCSQYRLRWFNVKYEPGELKAVAYRRGVKIGETTMRTAGRPVALKLTDDPYNPPDAVTRFVQVDALDAAGVRDPLAGDDVRFALRGPGRIVAVGNGNPKDHKVFTDVSHHPLNYGKCVAVVRRTGPGRIVLTACADGLASAEIEVK